METLRAWLLHHGRREQIAAALFVHPQTVRYRMGQLRELYGKRLEDPRTVLELTIALGVDVPGDDRFHVEHPAAGDRVSVDLAAAADFLAGSARVLDRRRFELLFGERRRRPAVLAAVDGYRNPDGGYGWGLEPDLRSRTSQPGGALHAMEVFADVAPATTAPGGELCDWLAGASNPDGGLPFALPVPDPAGCAPFWLGADPRLVAADHRGGGRHGAPGRRRRPRGGRAPVAGAGDRSSAWPRSRHLGPDPHAMVLAFAAQLLDAARHPRRPPTSSRRLRRHVPADGLLHVAGGADDEFMRPLDFAPLPGGPARTLFAPGVVDAELERLAAGQQPDGGWAVDFASFSPAATLEWRGHRTVQALVLLRANGLL